MKNKSHDYRDYLKELIEKKKSSRAGNSPADYARKLKISRSFLAQVFAKKKHLSFKKLNDLCALLKVTPGECMALVENFLEQVHSAKYLAKNVRKAKQQYFLMDVSTNAKLAIQTQDQKSLISTPLKSILFALCCEDISLKQIKKALRDQDIETADLKKTLKWLQETDHLEVKVVNGESFYKAKSEFFIATDKSQMGASKYLPWLPYIERGLANPVLYNPGRIQSYTGSFDDAAIKELVKAGDDYRARFLELSESSATDKAKVLYLQNVFFTLASRE